ncbi:unnamed protein product [Lupinus luteus]|uniref:Uncharacterized protein n=1 Tax=Lupinus luteus TaxID=3873 RepID=A0AAV1VXL2_LUPLU
MGFVLPASFPRASSVANGKSFEYESQDGGPKRILESIKYTLDIFYRFSRPYAALGATSVSFLAIEKLSDISLSFVINGWLKINKPYLPLASGEWSVETGTIIVASSLILDIPDMEGDTKFGIQSLSTRLGQKWDQRLSVTFKEELLHNKA